MSEPIDRPDHASRDRDASRGDASDRHNTTGSFRPETVERLRSYAARRAEQISQNEADLVLNRALLGARPSWTRHGLNALAAVALSLILIAGGIVLAAQLRGVRSQLQPATGPVPPIPNEIVDLDNPSQGPDLVTPLDLKTGKILPPRPRWALPQNRALTIYSTTDCSSSTIRVIDRSTQKDTQPEVALPDCYNTPILLPGTLVLLARHKVNANQQQFQDLGTVLYDWSAGRIIKNYPDLSMSFVGGLVSPDGTRFYMFNPFADSPTLDVTDLTSGARLAHVPVSLDQAGLNPGGLEISTDGRTLFVNQGHQIATFDARTGAAGPVLPFKDVKPGSTSVLPAWLASIDAEAKEGFEPNHGLAIDPKGRWLAALGADDATLQGIWIFNVSDSLRLLHHVDVKSGTLRAGFSGITSSLDGSLLYALDRVGYVDIFDPQTGKLIKQYAVGTNVFLGIGGVEPR